MKEIIRESYGKVNLALDVLYKREDGYHELNSIMQQIDLSDRLTFKEIKEGCIIESNNKNMPLDSRNLIYKVWEKLTLLIGEKRGIHIVVDKNIPMAAGLAGGSSNAATTLKALNQLWDIGLSLEELMDIGGELGADIPFCLMGGTALAKGKGEELTKLKAFTEKHMLIATPNFQVSTKEAYSRLTLDKNRIDLDVLIKFMEEDNLKEVGKHLSNKMEEQIISKHPIILQIKDLMTQYGSIGAIMSGSGPSVFGLFDDEEKIIFAKKKLLEKIDKVFISKTI